MSQLKRFITRHPLLAFFVLALGLSWLVWLPLVLAQNGLGLLPYTLPEIGLFPLSYWFAVPASILGPTLASFTVTAVAFGQADVRELLRRYAVWRVGWQWYLFLFVGLPLLQLVGAGALLGAAPLTAFFQKWPLYFTTYLPNIMIIALAVQIWEEGGWSGFAVPRLQRRFGAWRGMLILGPLWAIWHLPAFFVPGQIFDHKVGAVTMLVQMVILMLAAVPIRMVMTWVFNNTGGSILVAILLHAALDASNSASDYIGELLPASQRGGYGLATLLVPIVGALLLLILTKGRLSYTQGAQRN